MSTVIGKLVYGIETNADLKGITATKAELRSAQGVMRETQTESEKLGTKIERAESLFAKGAISAGTYTRAMDKYASELREVNAEAAKVKPIDLKVTTTGGLNKDLLGTGNMLAGQVPGVTSFTAALGTIGPIAAGAVLGLGGIKAGADLLVGTFTAVTSAVGEAMERIDSTTDAAAKLGVTGDALEGLRIAAQRAGVDAGTFDGALGKLNKNLGEAAAEGGEAAEKFSKLGLDVRALSSQKPDEAFKEIAAALSEIESPYERARAAQDLFGKSGQELIPVALQGADAIRQAESDAKLFGITIGEAARKDIQDANDRLEDLGTIAKGAAASLAVELAPAIRDVAGELGLLAKGFGGVQGAVGIFVDTATADIQALGKVIEGLNPKLKFLNDTLGLSDKVGEFFGGVAEEGKRGDELNKRIAEQQEKNKEFMQPESERKAPGPTLAEQEEIDKLRDQIAKDTSLPEDTSPAVRAAIEKRVAEAQKKLDALGGTAPTPAETTAGDQVPPARELDPSLRAQQERNARQKTAIEEARAGMVPGESPLEAAKRQLNQNLSGGAESPLEAAKRQLDANRAAMDLPGGPPGERDEVQDALDKLAAKGATAAEISEAEKRMRDENAQKTFGSDAEAMKRRGEEEAREKERKEKEAMREKERNEKDLRGFADRIAEKDNPELKAKRELEKLGKAKEAGVITPEEEFELGEKVRKEKDLEVLAQKKKQTGKARNTMFEGGTAEAFSFINNRMGSSATKNTEEKTEKNTANIDKNTADAAAALKDLKETMAKNLNKPVASLSI